MKQTPLFSSLGLLGKLLALAGCMACGLLIVTLGSGFFLYIKGESIQEAVQSVSWLKGMQLIQSVALFIAPVITMAYLTQKEPWSFLKLSYLPNRTTLMLTLISMVVMMPFMEQIILWNQSIHLPSFMEPIESWMRTKEEQANQMTHLLLEAHDWISWLFNLFLVGVIAAVGEEFFFRGTLQQYFAEKWKPWIAILISAFIFSAIHFQFYGFFPRFLLGAYFGYLLFWSQNLWIPIAAHFTNNAIALLQIYKGETENSPLWSDSISPSIRYIIAAVSLLLFLMLTGLLRKKAIQSRNH